MSNQNKSKLIMEILNIKRGWECNPQPLCQNLQTKLFFKKVKYIFIHYLILYLKKFLNYM
jgi:hypothetical protein